MVVSDKGIKDRLRELLMQPSVDYNYAKGVLGYLYGIFDRTK